MFGKTKNPETETDGAPVSKLSSAKAALGSFAKSMMPVGKDCGTKNDEVFKYKPSTYDKTKMIRESEKYAGAKINSILCPHSDTLKGLCTSIILHHLPKYLQDVSVGSPLFESTKQAYIYCIKAFCQQLPEQIAFKMIHKFMFDSNFRNFLDIFASSEFKFDQITQKYEPFSDVNFEFVSSKTVSELVPPPEINTGIESAELKYEFDPIEFNKESRFVQTITSFAKMVSSAPLSYGDTKALPKLAYKYMKEIIEIGVSDNEILGKLYGVFDEAVFRSVEAVNQQFINKPDQIPIIMCKYLITEHSLTSDIIKSSIKAFADMNNALVTSNQLINLDHMMGFYIYHSFRHKMDPSLKHDQIGQIYSDYAKMVSELTIKEWKLHPLQSIFKSINGYIFHDTLMRIVGKRIYRIPTSQWGGKKRTRKHRKRRKTRKYKKRGRRIT